MKSTILSFFLMTLLLALGNAQDTLASKPDYSSHALGLESGLNQVKDKNLIPLVHSGLSIDILYEYHHFHRNYQEINFKIGFSRLKTGQEDLAATADARLYVSYRYDFRINKLTRLRYLVGPQASLTYNVTVYPNWDESHGYWANYLSIGANNLLFFPLKNRKSLWFSLSLPVFSLYNRPDENRLYKIDDFTFGGIFKSLHNHLKPGFWNNAFFISLQTEYRFPVFSSKYEAISYTIAYTRIKGKDGLPFSRLMHTLGIRILL
jgi:hypothetical protein